MATKVNKREFKQLLRQMEQLRGDPHVKCGVFADSGTYPNGMTVVDVAIANEFGTDKIPERPFMRISARKMRPQLVKLAHRTFERVLAGTLSVDNAMDVIGAFGVKEIRATITRGVPPPNSPITIIRKGSSTPLVDTGQLRQSITYKKVVP